MVNTKIGDLDLDTVNIIGISLNKRETDYIERQYKPIGQLGNSKILWLTNGGRIRILPPWLTQPRMVNMYIEKFQKMVCILQNVVKNWYHNLLKRVRKLYVVHSKAMGFDFSSTKK